MHHFLVASFSRLLTFMPAKLAVLGRTSLRMSVCCSIIFFKENAWVEKACAVRY